MLTIWNPFTPVTSKADKQLSHKDYFNKLFDHTFDSMYIDLFKPFESIYKTTGIQYEELENSLNIHIDMPGVKETDLKVEITGSELSVKSERKFGEKSVSISKSCTIPKEYNVSSLTAEFKDGVLICSVKKEINVPKKIEITVNKP